MPQDDNAQLNVAVPRPLKVRVQHLALDQGKTLTELVNDVLQTYADSQPSR